MCRFVYLFLACVVTVWVYYWLSRHTTPVLLNSWGVCTTKKKKIMLVGVLLRIWFEICWYYNGVLILCSVSDRHAFRMWPRYWKFSGSTSPLCRTLPTMQNSIPKIIHQTSPATKQIFVLCFMGMGSWKVLISLNSQNESSHVENCWKRFQNPCPKNLLKVSVPSLSGEFSVKKPRYPYHLQQLQPLCPPNHHARVVFGQ